MPPTDPLLLLARAGDDSLLAPAGSSGTVPERGVPNSVLLRLPVLGEGGALLHELTFPVVGMSPQQCMALTHVTTARGVEPVPGVCRRFTLNKERTKFTRENGAPTGKAVSSLVRHLCRLCALSRPDTHACSGSVQKT
jgi:hypothetical protein